ncbi:hypothetical protein IWX46DRAFT_595549 [Phyllosticta citricarpa]|uniref:Secreted protein n=1 Tax=Phyllosticta citricarpa TaxID=55181 RepID=A0ABR1MIJ5_9PEZI
MHPLFPLVPSVCARWPGHTHTHTHIRVFFFFFFFFWEKFGFYLCRAVGGDWRLDGTGGRLIKLGGWVGKVGML